tara:strand:- start:210 stop:1349 length:1140 start_codon:yes stop_codon:yes gene_type:complete
MNRLSQGLKAISGAIGFTILPKEKRHITFYSEGKSYWPHLESLLHRTLEQTNKSVCYISSSLDDPGLMVEHPRLNTFFVGMGFVRDYFFQNLDTTMMVMTMPDLHSFQVKRSRHNVHYAYVQHSLVSLHMVYRHGAFDHYDTICAAGPHHVKEIRAIEAKYNLPPKNVVELGYSRLDSLIETAREYHRSTPIDKKTHKTILIAPSWGPEGVIESGLGKTLVKQLLNLEYEVILRPHPQTIKFSRGKVDEITNQHKGNPHFTFEGSVAGQQSLHQSDIMVSDWSGAALEYAFALNKPVIFCNVPRKVNNPNYQDIEIKPLEVSIREKIGVIWDGVSPVEELIDHCEQKSKRDLRTLTDQHVFNVGRSDRIFPEIMGVVKC